ncbi:hypothetical protein D3C81_1968730 [compost metagenome]
MFRVHSLPMATRRTTSTTSSPGRRPFGKPALSPPMTPRRFCAPTLVAAMDVFRRSISDAVTVTGWFTPLMPVKKVATRSLRGKLVGALAPAEPYSTSTRAGAVGLVT